MKFKGFLWLLPWLFFFNCKPQQNVDPIPSVLVDVYVNTNLPNFQQLSIPGGYAYIEGGVKGIVLLRNFSNELRAYDRCCSFQPLDTCARITADSSGLFFKCGAYRPQFIPCCGSYFDFQGLPTKSPAVRSLREYRLSNDNGLVHIFN